jgi:hypothetical protein
VDACVAVQLLVHEPQWVGSVARLKPSSMTPLQSLSTPSHVSKPV